MDGAHETAEDAEQKDGTAMVEVGPTTHNEKEGYRKRKTGNCNNEIRRYKGEY